MANEKTRGKSAHTKYVRHPTVASNRDESCGMIVAMRLMIGVAIVSITSRFLRFYSGSWASSIWTFSRNSSFAGSALTTRGRSWSGGSLEKQQFKGAGNAMSRTRGAWVAHVARSDLRWIMRPRSSLPNGSVTIHTLHPGLRVEVVAPVFGSVSVCERM